MGSGVFEALYYGQKAAEQAVNRLLIFFWQMLANS